MAKKIEYIRRDEAIRYAQWEGDYKLVMRLEEMKAADVQPVKCGEWTAYNRDCRGYADCFKCSCCENYVHVYCWQKQCDYDYCPNCGARMEQEGDTECHDTK